MRVNHDNCYTNSVNGYTTKETNQQSTLERNHILRVEEAAKRPSIE